MMGSDLHFRDKVNVGILGATGSVGQRFVQMLSRHPWFEISAVAASERSTGKKYRESVHWLMAAPMPSEIAEMELKPCKADLPCKVVFSGLDSSVAGEIETEFAQAGYLVISNSRNHRMDPDVPLLIPEINSAHLELINRQTGPKGRIVTNPNCSVIGLALSLKPLLDNFGIEAVHVVTLQAISGAGYPGTAGLDILDNVIPYIQGEEEKVETELFKILGNYRGGKLEPCEFKISAHCNRVPVTDGHVACVSVKLKTKASEQELIEAWNSFTGGAASFKLPTSPEKPIIYLTENEYPQPKLHRLLDKGMAVSIGRLRKCPLLDFKFVILSHNTIRGAAGGAILNAELMLKQGYIFW